MVEGNDDEAEESGGSGEKRKRNRKKRFDLASHLDTLGEDDFLDDAVVKNDENKVNSTHMDKI